MNFIDEFSVERSAADTEHSLTLGTMSSVNMRFRPRSITALSLDIRRQRNRGAWLWQTPKSTRIPATQSSI
jgi:hypothetical protein